jgi:hypothetical protein
MTREFALLIVAGVAALLVASGVWAWRRRVRRDGGLAAPVGEAPSDAEIVTRFAGFYVATTRHDEPLERLAIRGLAFRSRVEGVITTDGIALELPGQPRLFIPAAAVVSTDQATVAIDRVVENGGLARIAWRIDDQTIVDSYFRPQDTSTRAVVDAVSTLLPAQTPTTPTGSDA